MEGASGHHDSRTHPEFDLLPVPQEHRGAESPAAQEPEEPDWAEDATMPAGEPESSAKDDEVHAGDAIAPDDPACEGMRAPEDFGLMDKMMEFLGLAVHQLRHFVPPLRLQLGPAASEAVHACVRREHKALLEADPTCKYSLAAFLQDVLTLRNQHQNLLRRREEALQASSREGPDVLTKDEVAKVSKQLRRDFEGTEAQKQFRRLDKEVLQCDGKTVAKRQDSRFTAMVNQSYGGMRTFLAFVGTGKMADRKIWRAKESEDRKVCLKTRKNPLSLEQKQKKRDGYYENLHRRLADADVTVDAELIARARKWEEQASWTKWHLDRQKANTARVPSSSA